MENLDYETSEGSDSAREDEPDISSILSNPYRYDPFNNICNPPITIIVMTQFPLWVAQ